MASSFRFPATPAGSAPALPREKSLVPGRSIERLSGIGEGEREGQTRKIPKASSLIAGAWLASRRIFGAAAARPSGAGGTPLA
jgi:hypothetical protein